MDFLFAAAQQLEQCNRNHQHADEICGPVNEGVHDDPVEHGPTLNGHSVQAGQKGKYKGQDSQQKYRQPNNVFFHHAKPP